MSKKIKILTKSGKCLFKHKSKGNTLIKTLEKAIKKGISLEYADLQGANLKDAVLRGADLRSANLRGAYLHGVILHGANLKFADLENAYLGDISFNEANLQGASLKNTDLRGARFYETNLQGADLRNTDLPVTFLEDAKLTGVKLRNTDLTGIVLPMFSKFRFTMQNTKMLNIHGETKTFEEWQLFFENPTEDVFNKKLNTDEFKRVKAMFYAYKIYNEKLLE